MVARLLIGWSLMAACVAIHAIGMAIALGWHARRLAVADRFWRSTWVFIRIAGWTILLHLLEITTWGLFYYWRRIVTDLPDSLYFSAVTYTTTGYGDIVLPQEWRLVGGVEALTGILMCGWSTGFFFAIVSRMYLSQKAATKSV